MSERLLEIKNLQIRFAMKQGFNHVIRDVSLNVNRGETLALVGESGSGKSVTTKAVMGLIDDPKAEIEGTILYHDRDETYDLMSFREQDFQQKIRGKHISMIFQDPMTSLNPTMTVGKQIMEVLLIHKRVARRSEARSRTIEILDAVGIINPEERIDHYPHQLSGGMRQRIVIAIALACDPDLLIADEPTTALDVTIQAQILDLIKEIQARTHFAIIFITHDLGVVANVADRVAVMYAGQIVEEGLADEIFYNPKHPYTWGLLSSIPSLENAVNDVVYSIPGSPPSLVNPPVGDAFARRSDYALDIDFVEEPPFFDISSTHRVKSWLYDPRAPHVSMPDSLQTRINSLRRDQHDTANIAG